MNKKHFILAIILLFLCIGSFSPFGCTTTISGIVIDQNANAIEGVTITIEGFNPVTTGMDGIYTIENVPYGEHILTVEYTVFYSTQITISTSYFENGLLGKDIEADIKINKIPEYNENEVNDLRYIITTNKQTYSIGEDVEIAFIVENISNKTLHIGLSTISSDYIVDISSGSEYVYGWPLIVLWAVREMTLAIGESVEYNYTWDQKRNLIWKSEEGFYDTINPPELVTPGQYTIRMVLYSYIPPANGVSTAITIK